MDAVAVFVVHPLLCGFFASGAQGTLSVETENYMATIRAKILAAIGVISGARLGAEALRQKQTKPKPPAVRPGSKVSSAMTASSVKASAAPLTAENPDTAHNAMSEIYGPLGYAKELFTRFGADFCPAWAASLSFFSVLSIAPVLLCGLAVLGFLLQDPVQAANYVHNVISNLVPDQASADKIMADLNIQKSAETLISNRGAAGVIGLLSLFWSSLQIFVNASTPMNAAFRVKETRGWIKLRAVALGLLLGAGLLFLLSLVPATLMQYIANLDVPGLGHFAEAPLSYITNPLLLLVSVAVNALMFSTIYRYLPSPSARVSWREAGFAGTIVAVLWEAAKYGFGYYLRHFGNYNKVYGTLGGLVGLIFWIYYSSMILLLGAEIAKLYADAKAAPAEGLQSR